MVVVLSSMDEAAVVEASAGAGGGALSITTGVDVADEPDGELVACWSGRGGVEVLVFASA
jgi:hypothetical protein